MELLQDNIQTVLSVGKMLIENWHLCDIHHYKENKDYCTNLDLKAEEMLIKHLEKLYPQYNLLSEEEGLRNKNSEYTWVIDPIDGSKNFMNHLPFFNITIALIHQHKTIFGIVYSPATKEFFYAYENAGSYFVPVTNDFSLELNTQEKIYVSTQNQLKKATIHSELPTVHRNQNALDNMSIITKFFESCYRLRSIGSGALALAYTARGSYDAYIDFSRTTNIWDVAAGILLVEQAGGIVTDFQKEKIIERSNSTIATNESLYSEIINLVSP